MPGDAELPDTAAAAASENIGPEHQLSAASDIENIGPEHQLSADQLRELLMGGAALSGASQPTNQSFVEWGSIQCAEGSKNKEIHCPRCPSKICLADTAVLVESEMKMSRYKVDAPENEVVTKFWLLTSLMAFENIGVSHLVENIKFLSCADCEVGPIGWHDINDKTKFYIAAERVRYLE